MYSFLNFLFQNFFVLIKTANSAGFLAEMMPDHLLFAIKMVPYGTIIQGKWYRMVPFLCYFTHKLEFFASSPQGRPGKNVYVCR